MGKKTSVYLPDELAEAIRASGKSIPDLIRLGLQAGDRARGDRLADAVERMLLKLQDGYTFTPRQLGAIFLRETANQDFPAIPDGLSTAIGSQVRYLAPQTRARSANHVFTCENGAFRPWIELG